MKITFFSFNKSAFWNFKCTSGSPLPFLYYHVQVFGTAGALYNAVQEVPVWTAFEILRLSAWYGAVIAYTLFNSAFSCLEKLHFTLYPNLHLQQEFA